MHNQAGFLAEGLAPTAHIRLHPRVHHVMHTEIPLVDEDLATLPARVWLLLPVSPGMIDEVSILSEGLPSPHMPTVSPQCVCSDASCGADSL